MTQSSDIKLQRLHQLSCTHSYLCTEWHQRRLMQCWALMNGGLPISACTINVFSFVLLSGECFLCSTALIYVFKIALEVDRRRMSFIPLFLNYNIYVGGWHIYKGKIYGVWRPLGAGDDHLRSCADQATQLCQETDLSQGDLWRTLF